MVASRENFPLLAELLAEQQQLATPVARFAETHTHDGVPALEPVYRDLIPLSAPKSGEQYAFEVELDSCTGCKACVSACHSLNGLDDTETWRDVGLLVGGDHRHPFQQTITTACHHCADPACLNGCPVLAYDKDPVTGIVRHLDDQCIGCQYCVLKCPYDVPKYNARLGIVRKCDMCHGRLAEGEAPACVQACPTHAIRIVTVSTATAAPARPSKPHFTYYVKKELAAAETSEAAEKGGSGALAEGRRDAAWLPAAPAAAYTRPTTRYVSRKGLPPELRAGDGMALRVQPAHWPLVATLTLMPLAVGCFGAAALARNVAAESVVHYMTLGGAGAGALGLAASTAHLGQPLRAWRIFLGWRRSWLSREAMLFGAWLPLAVGAIWWSELAGAAAGLGLLALFCSAMIYTDTRREYWRLSQAVPRIMGSAVVLGAAVALAMGVAIEIGTGVLAAGVLVKLACDARVMRTLDAVDDEVPALGLVATARLLSGPLRGVFGARVVLGLVAGLLLPLWATMAGAPVAVGWMALAGVLLGELAERYLFFRAVDAPKMPGVVA